jgi:hypothetical protein
MIITGVASTGGNIASLNRLARCSGLTTRLNEPLAPVGMVFMGLALLRYHLLRMRTLSVATHLLAEDT